MEVRDNPKYYEKKRNKLHNNLNEAITIAANDAGITVEEAYAFMISFGEAGDNKKELNTDKDYFIKHLNNIIEAYKAQLNDLDTTDVDSIGTHKFLSGKIAGLKDAIDAIQKYDNWANNDDIV